MNIHIADIATAAPATVKQPLDWPKDNVLGRYFDSVQIALVDAPGTDRTFRLVVPASVITAQTKTAGSLSRPAGVTGWYPQRWCVTAVLSEFALPGTDPVKIDSSAEDTDGC